MIFQSPRMELLLEILDEVTMGLQSKEIEEDEDGYGPLIPL